MSNSISNSSSGSLRKLALWLAYATVTWNVIECIVAVSAGAIASSKALVGFGLDSAVEVLSALVIVWQLRGELTEEREKRALRLIAISFFVLAFYVFVSSVIGLVSQSEAETSLVGMALAVASLIVMPVLAFFKRRTGKAMSSTTVVADSKQTMLCIYLSVILLVGLVLDATLGWWWADPIAAIGIAVLAANEGREAWMGDDD
ncbi:MAG TPA: cation transporter [Acidimicrobiia bacterium]|nr:cation transporter [Acidimicrobiia bacterium]